MKRLFQYTAIVIALSFAASCNNIEEGTTTESGLIRFEPQSIKTKALVTPDNVTGEIFDVWDFMGTTVHIQDSIYHSGGDWKYKSSTTASYPWKSGAHKFFGYTRRNAGSFDQSTMIWSISERTITAGKNQTDLLYSSIKDTTATGWKNGHQKDDPVLLQFHHLLSAIRITMVNGSGAQVTVTNASVTLPNTGSASVSFAGTTAEPSYATSITTTGNFGSFTSQTMSAGDSLDVLTGAVLSDKATAYVIWPQDIDDDDVTISFDLAYGTNAATTIPPVTIPAGTWEAGKINNYKLVIYPEFIKLIFEVQPWEKVEVDPIDTSDGSINMTNVAWMNTVVKVNGQDTNTVVNNKYLVNMFYHPTVNGQTYTATNGYFPAQGYFTVNYPLKGKFKIGMIPAYGETTVDESMYEIWVYDETVTPHAFRQMKADGEDLDDWREYEGTVLKGANTIYFQVRATGQDSARHTGQIDIWFLPEGSDEWISAYSEIRANYALVIPAR